ncbi:TetR family transcriptional regulator [Microbispora sp. RL4-1S]|uniref:TetR family transcriptional regulator n=2 Tax=Microbispora oryzae TaxID=2806554 RepID=A0A941AKL5_9ACTN|nr:TetR family transcriptional regulator [Microbispora oryzae]
MGRVSRAQAEEHRRQVVEAASRLFRERGVQAVGLGELMGEVGLTHGGFYRQFASKDALVAEAVAQAFAEETSYGDAGGRPAGPEGARRDLLDAYLSPAHRDDAGSGCPVAGFGADMARDEAAAAAREPYAEGVRRFARQVSADGGEDLAAVCTMVGALLLARATAGTELSDEILRAARTALDG